MGKEGRGAAASTGHGRTVPILGFWRSVRSALRPASVCLSGRLLMGTRPCHCPLGGFAEILRSFASSRCQGRRCWCSRSASRSECVCVGGVDPAFRRGPHFSVAEGGGSRARDCGLRTRNRSEGQVAESRSPADGERAHTVRQWACAWLQVCAPLLGPRHRLPSGFASASRCPPAPALPRAPGSQRCAGAGRAVCVGGCVQLNVKRHHGPC